MKERSCPHGGMYCFDYGSCENCEWGKILQKNKRYRANIRELKEDLRIEKHNHGVTKEFYNNSVANSEKIFAEQKAEIETLKTELRKECEEHEEFTKKAKEEIERLTEQLDYFQKSSDYHEGNQKELEAKNAELQKQVDELTKENKRLTKENGYLDGCAKQFLADYQKCEVELSEQEDKCLDCPYMLTFREIEKQAVKNTAKEILCELLDLEVKDEDYQIFFLDVCEKLEKFAQKYGVEVE